MKNTEAPVTGRQPNGAHVGRKMYPATCSQCGKACEVPFVPNPSKPTYCRECFEKRKLAAKGQIAAKQHANNPVKNGNASDGDMRQQLSAINSKLDRLIQMLGSKEIAPVKVTEVAAPEKKPAKKAVAKKKVTPKKK